MEEGVMQNADWRSHHIEGFAMAALQRGLDAQFSAPLISHIITFENGAELHSGGCIGGVQLDETFNHVVSLYRWEQYRLAEGTTRTEYRAFDSPTQNTDVFIKAADEATERLLAGDNVLVHCQAGLNRSGVVSALTLMNFGFDAVNAIATLRMTRSPLVLCNQEFEQWVLSR